ncbi:MAG: serine/threonine protein kinase [Planctomycetales bacterium]|nr:serine/threonine protein kinase [Planctomycetales bacterium]
MNKPPPAASPTTAQAQLSAASEQLVEQFETAWREAAGCHFAFEPDVAAWSRQAPIAERQRLTLELIAVDLEFRWRYGRHPRRLEAYLARLLTWTRDTAPPELIVEAYRNELRWGGSPSRADYLARFPAQASGELAEALLQTEADLLVEGITATSMSTHRASIAGDPCEARSTHRASIAGDPCEARSTHRASIAGDPCEARSSRIRSPGIGTAAAPLCGEDFLLRRLIGVGGASRVYAAVQRSLDKLVAVKVLRRRWAQEPRFVAQLLAEARLAAQLDHPQIVGVHGVGLLPATRSGSGHAVTLPFLTMDFVHGPSLRDQLRCRFRRSPEEATRLIAELARIVHHVHRRGYFHGDISPGNVIMRTQGVVDGLEVRRTREGGEQPVLTDFGLSGPLGVAGKAIGGTPPFIAPEQLRGEPLTPAADIYSLASLWIALVSEHNVQPSLDLPNLIRQHRSAWGPATEMIQRCLYPDASKRYDNANTFAADMEQTTTR